MEADFRFRFLPLREYSLMAEPSNSQTSPTLLGKLRQSPTDQDAWEQFVLRYGPQIQSWCGRKGLQDADAHDVTQMVLLRVATHIRDFEYDPARSFRGWLRTICRHAWSDLASSRKNQRGGGGTRSTPCSLRCRARRLRAAAGTGL